LKGNYGGWLTDKLQGFILRVNDAGNQIIAEKPRYNKI